MCIDYSDGIVLRRNIVRMESHFEEDFEPSSNMSKIGQMGGEPGSKKWQYLVTRYSVLGEEIFGRQPQ